MMKHPKKECIGCGKITDMGIPYTVCKDCMKIIDNFYSAKVGYESTLMNAIGIDLDMSFNTGNEDIDMFLNNVWKKLARIQFEIHFINNSLRNIRTEFNKTVQERDVKKEGG